MTMTLDEKENRHYGCDASTRCERELLASSVVVPPPRHPLGYETTILKHRRVGSKSHEEGMDCWREPEMMSTAFQRHLEYRRAKAPQVASQISKKIRSLVSQIISSSSSSFSSSSSLWRGLFHKTPVSSFVWSFCFFAIVGLHLPQGTGALHSPGNYNLFVIIASIQLSN